ncbi:MAG: 4-phosphoerythronate dehydrogenase [Bacteroidia bacterium]|nr:4-phosphoerythronate dehydrogenase [Bacteroidia bacterium]
MRIAADINIPCIEIALDGVGELRRFDSRNPDELRAALRGADALLCRSTIRVNEELLRDSNVRFVATATSGVEHLDIAALEARGITVASAAGSNARSVADWLTASLFFLRSDSLLMFEGASIGIVGVGHVGKAVYHAAKALGLSVVLNDPPREQRGEKPIPGENIVFSSFDRALDCDILTLHVPLERGGPFPTYQMMDMAQFNRLGDGGIFINAARGDVMRSDAALLYADGGDIIVLDVYPNEPDINPAFLKQGHIVTAHIAGHSYDAKLLGTQMVYDALFAWMGRVPRWRHEAHLPDLQPVSFSGRDAFSPFDEVYDVTRQIYDIFDDYSPMFGMYFEAPEHRVAYFERIRAEYRVRREFHRATVKAGSLSRDACDILGELGFRIEP